MNVRLEDDLVQAIDLLALRMGIDRTELVARGLRRELLHEGGREFIYALLDEEGEVRYVGRSADPYRRLREHIAAARAGGRSAREAWLAELLDQGGWPRMAIIDDADPDTIRDVEAAWIERFAEGGRLTNGTFAGVAQEPRRDMAHNTTTHSFRLPVELKERLVEEAERQDRSVSWLIVRALESALEGNGAPQAGVSKDTPSSSASTSAPEQDPDEPMFPLPAMEVDEERPAKKPPPYARAPEELAAELAENECPDCGRINGIHKGDCPRHPRNQ